MFCNVQKFQYFKVFPDPQTFNPDRYLDINGNFNSVPEHIPFSMGRRQCAGEGLARMEMFLFTANLFYRYKFVGGARLPCLKKIGGNATVTEPFTCHVIQRQMEQWFVVSAQILIRFGFAK